MNSMTQKLVLGGVNVLALGISTGDATLLNPIVAVSTQPAQVNAMTSTQLRGIEASHLEVYAGCKWGHAAFDPIKVDAEPLSPEVQSLYDQMA